MGEGVQTQTGDQVAIAFTHGGAGGLRVAANGRLATASGAEAIRQSILMLLATIPGERVMRPDYGCHLHRLAFQPNDDTTAGMAMHYVKEAVGRFERRVIVEHVDAYADPERPEVLHIVLDYHIRRLGVAERLDYTYQLAQGTT